MSDHTHLVTPAQVLKQSTDSLPAAMRTALADSSSALYDVALRIIVYWTGRIEDYLARRLIVRGAEIIYLNDDQWIYREQFTVPNGDMIIGALAPDWPILQVVAVNGSTGNAQAIITLGREGEYLTYNYDANPGLCPRQVEYFWGYRRIDTEPPNAVGSGSGSGGSGDVAPLTWDEALGTGTDELASLDNDVYIPMLPAAITQACCNLVIAELRAQAKGITGIREASTSADKGSWTTSGIDRQYIADQFAAIYTHRAVY